jgi:hypothetical protein
MFGLERSISLVSGLSQGSSIGQQKLWVGEVVAHSGLLRHCKAESKVLACTTTSCLVTCNTRGELFLLAWMLPWTCNRLLKPTTSVTLIN